jgi:hypothetical protein
MKHLTEVKTISLARAGRRSWVKKHLLTPNKVKEYPKKLSKYAEGHALHLGMSIAVDTERGCRPWAMRSIALHAARG